MMTLNPFVENNKARINQFLNNLCEVGDFYDTLEAITFVILPYASADFFFFFWLLDGSIHGTFEKGSDDSHHDE